MGTIDDDDDDDDDDDEVVDDDEEDEEDNPIGHWIQMKMIAQKRFVPIRG